METTNQDAKTILDAGAAIAGVQLINGQPFAVVPEGYEFGNLECLLDQPSRKRAKVKMFERFNIAIPVFQGSSAAYPVECRLKFRQNSDALNFWYELIRPDRVFRQAVTDEIGAIKEKTGFMLLYGNPGL